MEPTQDLLQDVEIQKKRQDESQFDRVPLWEAVVGMLVVGGLYAVLPSKLIFGPSWLLIVIEVVFLLPIIGSLLTGRGLPMKAIRPLFLVLLGILTLALVLSIILLVATLPTDKYATYLLRAAVVLWSSNVLVFGLWYWQIDGGGPLKRHLSGHQATDFMFPQQVDGNKQGWVPHFIDYLFLAFTGSTALSPADTYPLTRPAKALMMIEAIISMATIVLLVGRAVNIFGS